MRTAISCDWLDPAPDVIARISLLAALSLAGLLTIGAAKLSPTERRMKAYEAAHPEARHIGGKVTKPELIASDQPRYPPEVLARRRTGGVILLEAVVDEHGRIKDPVVLRGLQPDLQPYFMDSVRKWRFEPARLNGKPVPVFYLLTVNICFQ